MAPMRILIGMPDPDSRSGPNACEPPFVAALRALGVEVVETTFVYGDNLEPISLAARMDRVTRTAWRLLRILRAGRFDLVHLNTSFDVRTVLRDSFTLTLLRRWTPPVFLKLHGSDASLLTTGRRPLPVLARYVIGRAAGIGVLSSTERAEFIARGVPREKLYVVRNALPNTPVELRSHEEFLAAHDLPANVPLLLFISRLIPTKGLVDVIHACDLLRDRGTRFALCCVGDGPARAEAEDEVVRLRLEDIVRFAGFVPEVQAAEFYRHCDVLVFPTADNEGLPVVLLNALSAGLPIVTTRIRGALDYLVEHETCLWVEPHRPEQLADRLQDLLESESRRAAMGARARETARIFEPATVAREYLDVYERLLPAAPLAASVGSVATGPIDPDTEARL